MTLLPGDPGADLPDVLTDRQQDSWTPPTTTAMFSMNRKVKQGVITGSAVTVSPGLVSTSSSVSEALVVAPDVAVRRARQLTGRLGDRAHVHPFPDDLFCRLGTV